MSFNPLHDFNNFVPCRSTDLQNSSGMAANLKPTENNSPVPLTIGNNGGDLRSTAHASMPTSPLFLNEKAEA